MFLEKNSVKDIKEVYHNHDNVQMHLNAVYH